MSKPSILLKINFTQAIVYFHGPSTQVYRHTAFIRHLHSTTARYSNNTTLLAMSAEDAIAEKHLPLAPTNLSESLDPTSASASEGDIISLNTTRESNEANGSGPEKLAENGHVDRETKEGKETGSREAEAALSTNTEPGLEPIGDTGAGEPSSESFTESGDTEPTEVAEGGPSWSEEDHEHKRVKVG